MFAYWLQAAEVVALKCGAPTSPLLLIRIVATSRAIGQDFRLGAPRSGSSGVSVRSRVCSQHAHTHWALARVTLHEDQVVVAIPRVGVLTRVGLLAVTQSPLRV